jgi:hypothetical protein
MITLAELLRKIALSEEMTSGGGGIAGLNHPDVVISTQEQDAYTRRNKIFSHASHAKIFAPPEVKKLPSRDKKNSKSVSDMLKQKSECPTCEHNS